MPVGTFETDSHTVVEAKPIWKSLTFWFNLLVGLASLLEWTATQGFAFTSQPWFLTCVAVVNTVLRFKSQIPVTLTGGQSVAVKRVQ